METGVSLSIHLSRIKWSNLVILFLYLKLVLVGAAQRFANQPSPQTAVIGSTVVLPCRVINMVGELQWTRDGFGLGNERHLYAFKRYKMIGSNEEGDYSLKISPVNLDDEAEFQCQVTGSGNTASVRSQTAKLTVYVPPEAPDILQGSVVKATAGAGVHLECISKGGKPAAEIQWLDGSGRVVLEGVKYTKHLLKDGHRYDSRSTFTLIAGREHHNAVFTCTATNPALHQSLKTQVRLEVTFPPDVRITQDKNGYKESQTAVLTCIASANPNKLDFRWYRGSKLVSNTNETQLVIHDVTRDATMEDITCEVSNAVGVSKKITRLVVHYGPSFRVRPADVYAEDGENVTLRCLVDGSPHPTIVWISQKNSSIFGNGPTLSLKAGKVTVGTYQCLAKVDGFPEISSTVGLFLKGPPVIRAERVQSGEIGGSLFIHCFIPSATPNSVTVSWSFKDKRIDFTNGRHELREEVTSGGLSVRLFVKQAKMEDFGLYNCSVQNDYGSDRIEILLKRKKTVNVMVVVTCVVGGLLGIIVCAGAVLLFGRRTTSKQKDAKNGGLPEKSVSLQLNDQNSNENDSDLKVELDNRTGSSLSSKEQDLEQSWEKDETVGQGTPTYMSSNTSYLYPETFTGIPLKVNGHISSGSPLTYSDYTDHLTLTSTKPITQKQQHPIPTGFSTASSGFSTAGSGFSPRSHVPLVTSSQHNLFHAYPTTQEYELNPDSVEGLRGLSSTFSNGFSSLNYKNNTATLPLSLHLNRNSGINQSVGLGTVNSVSPSVNAPNNRLGIPVDSSQYIVPPRTQLLQGALATHV